MAYTTIKKPSDYFNTKLYTGDGTDNRAVTGVGFQPDFLWIKDRSNAFAHALFDVVRTPSQMLVSSSTDEEQTNAGSGGLTSFDADGFTTDAGVGSNPYRNTNENGDNYVSWNWLANGAGVANTDGSISSTVSANTTSGFSIVSYSGNGTSDSSIGHGLGATPKITITKNLTTANSWRFTYYFVDGSRDRLLLDSTTTKFDSDPVTADDNNVFYVDAGGEQNTSGNNYIAYCFAEKQGYSKFGSYTGNGNADGPFIYTGFKPAMVILKNTSIVGNWQIMDNRRNTYNAVDTLLKPNDTIADQTPSDAKDFLSNGFKLRNSAGEDNGSGNTFIYMAFAEEPLVGDNPATAR